ncbi:DUF226 domain-containing protein [Borrelia miyamotoi]|uniref:DUF226 domain-containing protein n=1 Tax=Borrelia miyamotoi TaxID=47466 RepID=A0A0U2X6M1_9SPIR|nr:DUF226 domain-containing protein [Borrelia miyamotoi]ALU34118.1 PF50-like protein [Borrelia miyamotoi]AOW96399.1 partition protein [Borrelia miyamotoi]QTL84117.1 DUF226 domain-containing protein [Borrelia miyamotoi]WAZ85719.1 DUF226 domain-containing protein [Borrelia miyamotoi]WAZ91501.1 DUF226 domain-containing protein [Borrelia miyamotoi]
MVALLELLKQKKKEIYPRNHKKEKNNIFSKVEEVNNRKIYHTKIFNDFYTFGISKNEPTKFFISLRGIFNIEDISMFHLFSLRGDDIFLGIYYGIKKLDKAFLVRNFNKRETYTLRKCEYIEFRFKKGGVFCYLSGLHNLLKKNKVESSYYQTLLNILLELERELYAFYGKQLPEGGIIPKWIQKRQK